MSIENFKNSKTFRHISSQDTENDFYSHVNVFTYKTHPFQQKFSSDRYLLLRLFL